MEYLPPSQRTNTDRPLSLCPTQFPRLIRRFFQQSEQSKQSKQSNLAVKVAVKEPPIGEIRTTLQHWTWWAVWRGREGQAAAPGTGRVLQGKAGLGLRHVDRVGAKDDNHRPPGPPGPTEPPKGTTTRRDSRAPAFVLESFSRISLRLFLSFSFLPSFPSLSFLPSFLPLCFLEVPSTCSLFSRHSTAPRPTGPVT